jgi:hypothetical protein
MSPAPVARFLADFDADAGSGDAAASLRERGWDKGAFAGVTSPAARIEAAHREGYESGRMAAQAVFDAKLAELKASQQQQLAAARRAWAAEEGAKLAERVTAGFDALEDRIANAAARALQPLLHEAVRTRAVAELTRHVQALIAKQPGVGLSIAGPEDLVVALQAGLAGASCAIAVRTGAEAEVRVLADQSVLETRLKDWIATLEAAVR